MELQSPTNTAHRPKRRTQPILTATDGGRSTFGLIYGLDQEVATAQQQPPPRFRPSNYTVDLSNTTNPPPPQVMVKPAVMLRRDERPQPVSFTVTDAARHGSGRDGVLLRIHLGSRHISERLIGHLI